MEGLHPIWISVHPTATAFVYDPPLNAYERAWHAADPDAATAAFTMLTYGPDLNLSLADRSTAATVALGMKLTALSPFIIPFSFSAPLLAGARWPGLSARTYYRAGRRPAVRVYVPAADSQWPMTAMIRPARLPSEVGRIEFKACDSCADLAIYAGLLALLKGLAHDRTLLDSAAGADVSLHQRAARWGFDDPQIRHGAQMVLQAADTALADDPDAALLSPLWAMLGQRMTPAHAMIARLNRHGSVGGALRPRYTLEAARSQPRSDSICD
jgi:hypothetical protein